MSIWRDWLPVDLPARVNEQEPGRFAACIRALKQQWEADACKSSADRSQATLPWISLFKRCVARAKMSSKCRTDTMLGQSGYMVQNILDCCAQPQNCQLTLEHVQHHHHLAQARGYRGGCKPCSRAAAGHRAAVQILPGLPDALG